jgi:hypothetical protein
MLFNGYIHTGRRCFAESAVQSMDLWATDSQAELLLSDYNNNRKVLLDEDESRVIRDWAAAAMQCAIVSSQGYLLEMRCDLQEQLIRARKLNRAASRARKQPAKVAKAASVVDINVWRRAAEQPAVELALAA